MKNVSHEVHERGLDPSMFGINGSMGAWIG
jgi:hypothetical protein